MVILFAVVLCTKVEIYVITTYDSHKALAIVYKLYIISSTLNDWIIHRESTENGFEPNERERKKNRTTHYEKGKNNKTKPQTTTTITKIASIAN